MKFFCFFLLLLSISSSPCNCSNDDYDDLVRKSNLRCFDNGNCISRVWIRRVERGKRNRSSTTARPTTGVKGGLQDILSTSSCQHLKENQFFLKFPTLKKLCLRTLVQAKIVKLTTGTSSPPATKEAKVNKASTAESTRTTSAPPPRTQEATVNKASIAQSTRTTTAKPPTTMVDDEVEAQKDNPTNEQPSQPPENSCDQTNFEKKDKKQYPFINMGIW